MQKTWGAMSAMSAMENQPTAGRATKTQAPLPILPVTAHKLLTVQASAYHVSAGFVLCW